MSKARDLADIAAGSGDLNIDSNTLFVDASENKVGIGTSSPSYPLHVVDSADSNVARIDGSSSRLYFQSNSGSFDIVSETTASAPTDLKLRVSGGAGITIDSSGNVGIGTTSPDTTFHVLGDNQVSVLAGSNANTAYNTYKYNTSAVSGYIGNGSSLLTGANDSDFIVRSQADLVFASNGNNRTMTLDTSGNVGIGTTTVGQFGAVDVGLTVDGGGAYSGIACTDGATTSTLAQGYSTTYLYNQANGSMLFGTNNTERMRIDSSGNVGIGTTSPTLGALQVNDDSDTTYSTAGVDQFQQLTLVNESPTEGDARYSQVGFYVDGGTHTSTGAIGLVQPDEDSRAGALFFKTKNAGGTVSEHMRIDSSGNVGIGTSSPASELHVKGEGEILRIESTDATGDCYITFRDSSANKGYIGYGSSTHNHLSIENRESSSDIFFQVGTTEAMRIDSSGNVGIGTASPSSTLTVGGDKYVLTNSGQSDGLRLYPSTAPSDGDYTQAISFGYTSGSSAIAGLRDGADSDQMGLAFIVHSSATGSADGEEAMRIDSSGNLLVGTSTATTVPSTSGGTNNLQWVESSGRPQLLAQSHRADGVVKINVTFNDSSTRDAARFYRTGTEVGSISCSTTATAYNTSSDYRLKENVVDMTGAVDRVKTLNPSQFNFIADPDRTVDGFLAHEVSDVVPEAVTGTKDAVDADGNPEYQGIDQSKLVPLLTAALKEAIAKIETLETRIEALEAN